MLSRLISGIVLGILTMQVSRGDAQCSPATSLGSIVAEIKRDSLARPAPGERSLDYDIVVIPQKENRLQGTVVYSVSAPRSSTGSVFRFARAGSQVYRLRGWNCSNLVAWLREVGSQPDTNPTAVWQYVFEIARALNPVGDRTRFIDSSSYTQLGESQLLPTMELPDIRQPRLTRDGNGWSGTVSIFWSNVGYHGLKTVIWDFTLQEGRLVELVETDIGSIPHTNKALLGKVN